MNDVQNRCRRTWRRLGVAPGIADSMVDELAADMTTAAADGVTSDAFVGGDPEGFARAWASARGVVRPRWRVGSTTVVALVALLPGAAIAMCLPLAVTSRWFIEMVDPNNPTLYCVPPASACPSPSMSTPSWVIAGVYGIALLVAYFGSLLSVSAWLRRCADPARMRTLRAFAVTLPVGAFVAGVLSRLFDNRWGSQFHADGQVSITHAWPVLFTALLVTAIATTRWWTVRQVRQRECSAPASPSMVFCEDARL